MKVVSVNAYVKKLDNGKEHQFVAITLDNKETVFVNTGLVVYAVNNAKEIKDKKGEQPFLLYIILNLQ